MDLSGIGTVVGAGASVANAVAGNIINATTSRKNLELQKEQFAYNKWLNQHTIDREDTAVRRGMTDMILAGLNPNSQFGGAAQSSGSNPVAQSPQSSREYKPIDLNAMVAMSSIAANKANEIKTNAEATKLAAETKTEEDSRQDKIDLLDAQAQSALASAGLDVGEQDRRVALHTGNLNIQKLQEDVIRSEEARNIARENREQSIHDLEFQHRQIMQMYERDFAQKNNQKLGIELNKLGIDMKYYDSLKSDEQRKLYLETWLMVKQQQMAESDMDLKHQMIWKNHYMDIIDMILGNTLGLATRFVRSGRN